MARDPRPTKPRSPWDHAAWDAPVVAALQAMERGTATPHQYQLALRWIVEGAAQTYERSFVPGDEHATAFLEGRRDVGRQIVKLMSLKLDALKTKGE